MHRRHSDYPASTQRVLDAIIRIGMRIWQREMEASKTKLAS